MVAFFIVLHPFLIAAIVIWSRSLAQSSGYIGGWNVAETTVAKEMTWEERWNAEINEALSSLRQLKLTKELKKSLFSTFSLSFALISILFSFYFYFY